MNATFDFSGKKAIITGAAGIIGSWISRAFVESGCDVWLVGRNEANLQKLKGVLHKINDRAAVEITSVDLQQEADILMLRDQVAAKWGAPDFVINNAGIYPNSLMLDITTELWDNVMNLNVRGTFLMIKYFSRLMIDAKVAGCFVNLISRSARIPRMGAVHYATSKVAIETMTRGYAMELAQYGIRMNALSPGFAPGSDLSFLSDDYIANMCAKIPLGRTSGPNDAPQAVLFLCSDNAAYITGTSLFVDGGNTAGDFSQPLMGSKN